jgi:hypothetical protein
MDADAIAVGCGRDRTRCDRNGRSTPNWMVPWPAMTRTASHKPNRRKNKIMSPLSNIDERMK